MEHVDTEREYGESGITMSEYLDQYLYEITHRSLVNVGPYIYAIMPDRVSFYGLSDRSMSKIEIPETVEIDGKEHEVSEISEFAFYCCTNLMSVKIPDSIEKIGISSFENCYKLRSILFNSTSRLKTISYNSFKNCNYLKSISIPNDVINIGPRAFENCNKLTSVIFKGNSLETIGENAFNNCTSLTKGSPVGFILPDSVKNIEYQAFSNCLSLHKFSISPRSQLSSIGQRAFFSCEKLKTFCLPSTVKEIKKECFKYCFSLNNILFAGSDDEISIAPDAFITCSSLRTVNMYGPREGITSDKFMEKTRICYIDTGTA
jgi:hypothetical protein